MRSWLIIAALLLPQSTLAASTVWEFQGQTTIDGWNIGNIEANLLPEGLLLQSNENGQLVREADISHDVDVIEVTVLSPASVPAIFIWRAPGQTGTEVYQIPMNITGKQEPQTIALDLQTIKEWSPRSDRMGFVFPNGGELVLQKIELKSTSIVAKLGYALRTLARFDDVRPYTVNFLWGPLVTYSEVQYLSLFQSIPPAADSANIYLYGLLIIAGIVAGFIWFTAPQLRNTAKVSLLVLVAMMWLAYDIRMGAELITYATDDYATWSSKELTERTYRDRGNFNVFAELVAPQVRDKSEYIFLASRGWPYVGSMKYYTYPARLVDGANATADISTWVVFDRPDITVNDAGELVVDNEVVTGPGQKTIDLGPGMFVYELN